MSVREVLAQGPLRPPVEPTGVTAKELSDGDWVLYEESIGRWMVIDDQHMYERWEIE